VVAGLCERLGVPHSILAVQWDAPPTSAVQEQARALRYGALGRWIRERHLGALATGHQLDDQAETLVMRLNRGSGVRGLGGIRRAGIVPGDPELSLLRPLLGWRRSELEEICALSGLSPAIDPSNSDARHERARIRGAIAMSGWLDVAALARSADHLASADEALDWAANREWTDLVDVSGDEIVYRASAAPAEIVRRVVARAIAELGTEGIPDDLRGRELDRLIVDLCSCNTTTLRGVRCVGGSEWRFSRAAPRSKWQGGR
jgi:tRNA(Ile)-lysidine synthase